MLRHAAGLALLSTLAATVPAQVRAPVAERKVVIQTSPLGFLQFGPTAEVVFKVAPKFAVSAGVRITSLGLIPALMNEDGDTMGFGMAVGGSFLFLPTGQLKGWYVGPHIEAGFSDSKLYESTVFAVAPDFGYRWMFPSGFTMTAGGALGAYVDDWQSKTYTYDKGTDIYPFAMLIFNLGKAF